MQKIDRLIVFESILELSIWAHRELAAPTFNAHPDCTLYTFNT